MHGCGVNHQVRVLDIVRMVAVKHGDAGLFQLPKRIGVHVRTRHFIAPGTENQRKRAHADASNSDKMYFVRALYALLYTLLLHMRRQSFLSVIQLSAVCKNQLIYRVNFPITIILCNLQEG